MLLVFIASVRSRSSLVSRSLAGAVRRCAGNRNRDERGCLSNCRARRTWWSPASTHRIPFLVLVLALRPALEETGRARREAGAQVQPGAPPKELVIGASVLVLAGAIAVPSIVSAAEIDRYTRQRALHHRCCRWACCCGVPGRSPSAIWIRRGRGCHGGTRPGGRTAVVCSGSRWQRWWPCRSVRWSAIPSFRLSGRSRGDSRRVGLLFQNLLYTTFSCSARSKHRRQPTPCDGVGLNLASDKGYYFVALVIAVVASLVVVMVRRSARPSLISSLVGFPAGARGPRRRHAADAVVRLLYLCAMAAVGGAMVAGVTGSASSYQAGSFGYFTSLVIVAVLVFCGRLPLLVAADCRGHPRGA